MLQEIIWRIRPDLIIETGIAHGGSLVFFASMLENIGGDGEVLGIDIDIRVHNWGEIIRHRMSKRIIMIEGSSIDQKAIAKVESFAKNKKSILVVLDSNHIHDHVLAELEIYAPFVTIGSYCIVFDTYIDNYIDEFDQEYSYNSWKGDNPKTAVSKYLSQNDSFEVDTSIEDKALKTAAPGGYLKRVR